MSVGSGYYRFYKFVSDTHPKTSYQWNVQQSLANTFGIGGVYRDWMVGRSANERNAHTRSLYGLGDVSGKYPWLSAVNSTSPTVRAVSTIGGLGAGAGVFRKLYGDNYRPKRRDSWFDKGYM